MKLQVIIHPAEEGGFWAEVPAFAGCVSEGETLEETLLNIKEAETFCKAHGYKFVITSAFEQRFTKEYFINTLGAKHEDLINSIPWDNVLYPKKCKSFIELLLHYDGRPELAYGEFYDVYSKLKKPTQYITNCCHPTREGYRIIAEELSNFIKEKGYV